MQQALTELLALSTAQRPVILCVDDDRALLQALSEQLRNMFGQHCRIEIAESADEALEVLSNLSFHGRELAMIISDQVMPNSSLKGDELLVAAHKRFPEAIKIMLTGQANAENVGNAINKANLYRYMSKPWDSDDMRLTLEEGLRIYLTTKQLREQEQTLKLLEDTTRAIGQTLDLHELSRTLITALQQYSEASKVVVVGHRQGELTVEATSSPGTEPQVLLNIPLSETTQLPVKLVRDVAESQEMLFLEDVSSDPRYSNEAYLKANQVSSLVACPVMNMGKLVAVFYLEAPADKAFTPRELNVIQVLASKSAEAMVTASMFGRLGSIIEDRTGQLDKAYKDLLALSSHKDKILQIAAHDIRSPLSGAENLASLLQEPDTAANPEQVIKYAGILRNSLGTILSLVNDILDLAKLESGAMIVNREELPLGEFLNGLAKLYLPQVQSKGVDLQVTGSNGLSVQADRTKLTQAVNNLIANAIKFTPKGGQVLVRYGKQQEAGKDYASIEVADTGIGISPESIPNLFDKFTPTQRSGTKGEKGTGLGLSIAKEIVELHQGEIRVASDVGMGTTFTILLPL